MVSEAARRNLEAHIAAERAYDLDAVMAPLSNNPRYVIQSFLVDGREAVRAMYELGLVHQPPQHFDEYLQALDDARVVRWGDAHCVLEYTNDYPMHKGMVVVVHFEGDRIRGENTYFTSLEYAKAMAADDKLANLPGVTRIV